MGQGDLDMKPVVIQMKGICKIYYTEDLESHVLQGVDMEIYEGDYISISGPSGCGKSTLLSLLGLLDVPTAGQYWIDGHEVGEINVTESAEIRNEKIGFIFQSFNLIDDLSVFDNIALPLEYAKKTYSEAKIRERVKWCLDKVDMNHRTSHRPSQLSGGQQQRVAIARALVANPAILLVDEPTGNLDSKNSDVVMGVLHKLNQEGTTLCMVTHEPRYADMATRQLHLLDGKMVDSTLGTEMLAGEDVLLGKASELN
jgi:putative ABC transport system ATP-binding protein